MLDTWNPLVMCIGIRVKTSFIHDNIDNGLWTPSMTEFTPFFNIEFQMMAQWNLILVFPKYSETNGNRKGTATFIFMRFAFFESNKNKILDSANEIPTHKSNNDIFVNVQKGHYAKMIILSFDILTGRQNALVGFSWEIKRTNIFSIKHNVEILIA